MNRLKIIYSNVLSLLQNGHFFQKLHSSRSSFPYDCQPFWEQYYILSVLSDTSQYGLYRLITEENPCQDESLLLILPFATKELAFFKWLTLQDSTKDSPALKNHLILENHLLLHLQNKAAFLSCLDYYSTIFSEDVFPSLLFIKEYLCRENEKSPGVPSKEKHVSLYKPILRYLLYVFCLGFIAALLYTFFIPLKQKNPVRNKEPAAVPAEATASLPPPDTSFSVLSGTTPLPSPAAVSFSNNISPAVYSIDMEGQKLSDLNDLQPHKETTMLQLSGNQLSNISQLSSFERLRSLYLENNLLSDIYPLEKLIHLQYLYLGNNQITNISSLHSLIALRELYLNDNSIEDISSLKHLKSLSILLLQNNTVLDVTPLKDCLGLEYLDLSGNENLQNAEALAQLPSLTFLNLIDTGISPKELQTLQLALPECTILK